MTLPLNLYKWTRFITWGAGTFGMAYGLPSAVEWIFSMNLPKWLFILLFGVGFFTGGLATPILLGKVLFAQCPVCKKAMRLVKTVGSAERYECADCWKQYEISYPKVGVRH